MAFPHYKENLEPQQALLTADLACKGESLGTPRSWGEGSWVPGFWGLLCSWNWFSAWLRMSPLVLCRTCHLARPFCIHVSCLLAATFWMVAGRSGVGVRRTLPLVHSTGCGSQSELTDIQMVSSTPRTRFHLCLARETCLFISRGKIIFDRKGERFCFIGYTFENWAPSSWMYNMQKKNSHWFTEFY